MWLNHNPTNIKRANMRIRYFCGHELTIAVHPDTSPEQRAELREEKKHELCDECVAKEKRKQTRERSKQR